MTAREILDYQIALLDWAYEQGIEMLAHHNATTSLIFPQALTMGQIAHLHGAITGDHDFNRPISGIVIPVSSEIAAEASKIEICAKPEAQKPASPYAIKRPAAQKPLGEADPVRLILEKAIREEKIDVFLERSNGKPPAIKLKAGLIMSEVMQIYGRLAHDPEYTAQIAGVEIIVSPLQAQSIPQTIESYKTAQEARAAQAAAVQAGQQHVASNRPRLITPRPAGAGQPVPRQLRQGSPVQPPAR